MTTSSQQFENRAWPQGNPAPGRPGDAVVNTRALLEESRQALGGMSSQMHPVTSPKSMHLEGTCHPQAVPKHSCIIRLRAGHGSCTGETRLTWSRHDHSVGPRGTKEPKENRSQTLIQLPRAEPQGCRTASSQEPSPCWKSVQETARKRCEYRFTVFYGLGGGGG